MLLLIAAAMAGCEEKQEGGGGDVKPELSVMPTSISATATADNYTLTVTCNTIWTAEVEDAAARAWCTITNGTKGSEDGTITLQTAQNTITEARHAIITITTGTLVKQVTVTQAAAAPMLNVDKTAIDATSAAASYSVAITSNTTWTATVSSAATWCTLAGVSATGNGTVTVNVVENPTIEPRAATVTVASGTLTKTVAVIQAAAAPVLNTDKTAIDAANSAGNYPVAITSNTAWTASVSSGATWCTLTNANASGNGTVTVDVAANTATDTRAATITVASGTLTKTVTVTQTAATPALNTDKTAIDAANSAGNYPVAITSNTAWTASVSSGATWCTLTNANASGNGTVTVNVSENAATATRAATVTVASGTLTKTVTVTQTAATPALNTDKTAISAAATAGNYAIGVTSNATWTASVNSAATWCTLTNAGATGNGTVTVNVSENAATDARAATVTVTSGTFTKQITVTQAAAAAPTLEVDKTTIAATVTAAAYTIGVTSNATWTASVNSAATWCTLTNAGATGNGTVTVNVLTNTATATRAATVTVTSGTLTKQVTVTQAATAAPTLEVDKTTIPAIFSAATYAIGVTSNQTWTTTVNAAGVITIGTYTYTITLDNTPATWCTLTNAGATGNGTVTVNVAENSTTVTRIARVTITAGTLTEAVTITQEAALPILEVDQTTIEADNVPRTYLIIVTSNLPWTATMSPSETNDVFCQSAIINGKIAVDVLTRNYSSVARSATLTVTAGTLTKEVVITQPALIFEIDKTTIDVGVTEYSSSYTVAVTSNGDWRTVSTSGWFSVWPEYGIFNGTITVNVKGGATVTRTGTFTVRSGTLTKTVTITQAAALILEVDKTTISMPAGGGNDNIAVRSNLAWSASVDPAATWCTLIHTNNNDNGTYTDSGTFYVRVANNNTTDIRVATITVASGTLTKTVTVTQEPPGHFMTVDKQSIQATSAAATYTVDVRSDLTWTASVSPAGAAAWCTLTNNSGSGNGTVTVNIAENTSTTKSRGATFTIASGTLTHELNIKQSVVVRASTVTKPTYAASNKAWIFGAQTWSDAIRIIPDCNKSDFTMEYYNPQCRSYTYTKDGSIWYYYNWTYVHDNAKTLCPSPWRVPTNEDFSNLADMTSGLTLINEWGGGGYVSGGASFTTMAGYYWSSDFDYINRRAVSLEYSNYVGGYLFVIWTWMYDYGYQVRCVR